MESSESLKKYSLYTATAIVISNMVGTGVFTSLGFQVLGVDSVPALLALWIVGGIIATSGALTYGELSSAFPKSGGEYNFLSRLYHPAVGFLSGYVSATVGFAAPIALAAMALGKYMGHLIPGVPPMLIACATVVTLSAVHILNLKLSGNFQKVITSSVVVLIVGLIVLGLTMGHGVPLPVKGIVGDFNLMLTNSFAVSLIYVSYSYSGWNAAAYITEDINNPRKNVPLALLFGTLIVMTLYVLVNFTFLYLVPIKELAGQIDVGFIAASKIFGDNGGMIISIIISICLLSAISGMTLVGPRVTQSIYKTMLENKFKSIPVKAEEIPYVPILFQTAISLFLIVTYSFDQVLTYVGFTLSLFTSLTVAGIFILRTKFKDTPRTYKTWGYPITPIVFLVFEAWMLGNLLFTKTFESLSGLATVLSGIPVYYILKKINNSFSKKNN